MEKKCHFTVIFAKIDNFRTFFSEKFGNFHQTYYLCIEQSNYQVFISIGKQHRHQKSGLYNQVKSRESFREKIFPFYMSGPSLSGWGRKYRDNRYPMNAIYPGNTRNTRITRNTKNPEKSCYSRSMVSVAIISSSSVGMTQTVTLESSAEMIASSPRVLFRSASNFTPRNSMSLQTSSRMFC